MPATRRARVSRHTPGELEDLLLVPLGPDPLITDDTSGHTISIRPESRFHTAAVGSAAISSGTAPLRMEAPSAAAALSLALWHDLATILDSMEDYVEALHLGPDTLMVPRLTPEDLLVPEATIQQVLDRLNSEVAALLGTSRSDRRAA